PRSARDPHTLRPQRGEDRRESAAKRVAGEQGDGTAGLRCDDVERGKKEPVRVVREPEATLARSRVRPFEQGICLYGAFACQALFNARVLSTLNEPRGSPPWCAVTSRYDLVFGWIRDGSTHHEAVIRFSGEAPGRQGPILNPRH